MSLQKLLELNTTFPKSRDALSAIKNGAKLVQIEGLAAAAKGWMIAGAFVETGRTMFVVTYTYEQAERIAEDLCLYGIPKDQVLFFPPSDAMIYEEGPPDFSVIGERLGVLHALSTGKTAVVVAPINAALRRTMPRTTLAQCNVTIDVGEDLDMDDFVTQLVKMGYERTDVVDRHGEFSRRGGIVDVYASSEEYPLRIELFGDEIESIRHFDSATQRSIDKISTALLLPAREVVLTEDSAAKAIARIRKELAAQIQSLDGTEDRESAKRISEKVEDDITRLENGAYFDEIEYYLPYLHPDEISIFDYLPVDAITVLDEPMQIKSHWEQHEEKMMETLINRAGRGLLLASQKRQHVPFESTIKHALSSKQAVSLALLPRPVPWAKADTTIVIDSKPMDSFAGRIEAVADQIKTWLGHNLTVIIASGQDKRMLEIMDEYGIPATSLEDLQVPVFREFIPETHREQVSDTPTIRHSTFVAHAPLRSGFKLQDAGVMVVTDSEIFGAQRMHRARKTSHEGIPISSVLDLKEGDYVVHINHGIGYYRGITKLKSQGVEREYLLLEYAGNDKLYVPSDQIDRVQKYIGGEGNPPVVHRLGGSEWMKTTTRVKKAVQEMARELVELYAWRQALGGHPFSHDTPWQQETESAFPYNETPDQIGAI